MAVKRVAIVLWLGCVLFLISQPPSAAGTKKKAAKSDPALPTVEKVLRDEVAGEVDRRRQLADTLKQHAESQSARWQAGFVKDGDTWRSFDEPAAATSESELLKDYRVRRDDAPRTFSGQLDLANWCRKHGFKDQERSHLYAALATGAGDKSEQVAERLGYRQVSGRWLSPEQRLEWQALNRRAAQSLKKWESQLRRLADRVAGPPAQRELAVARLKNLADNSAIPAIEYVFAGENEATAHVAVELLRSLDGFEASLALARQAVFSPWDAVRKSAGEALKGRPLDHFVPDLLGLLSSSVKAEMQFFERADRPGILYYNMILAQETENQFQVAVLTTADHTLNNGVVITLGAKTGRLTIGHDPYAASSPLAITDRNRAVQDRLRPREDLVVRQNAVIAETNERVSCVLSVVSGEEAKTEPQDWWQWWAGFSDLEYGSAKQVTVVSEQEDTASAPPVRAQINPYSCFAAGTPVWTETGALAIETIKVGDRVLAKDIETGELAYKPVLQTTVRPPKELTTLRFGEETIVCTGGHRFWSSGSGWIKARDLQPQTLLHTVTGNTPVWSAKKGNTAETYNLVVADFHTYFVGKTVVLCQDLLIPRGTNNDVPGLIRK